MVPSSPAATDRSVPTSPSPIPTNRFATAALVLGVLSLAFGLLTVGPTVLCGVIGAVRAGRVGRGKWRSLIGIGLGTAGAAGHALLAWGLSEHFRDAKLQARDKSLMRNLPAFACPSYVTIHGTFPQAYYWTGPGPPSDPTRALSWRVSLLPYLDEQNLYAQFDPSQPWDGRVNGPLMRGTASFADNVAAGDPFTRYRVFYDNGAAFELHRPVAPREFHDGTTNTILFVQSGQPVPWTQFNELPFDPAGPLPPLGRPDRDWFLAAMADGSVRTVRKTVDPAVMKAAITRAGSEPPPDGSFSPLPLGERGRG
jgi:hypothetical protein